jgi:dihydrofolate reductase
MEATIVVAMTPQGGIGYRGALPWRIPSELRHFHRLTTTTTDPKKINAVVMGRATWDSLPIRPLPKRVNVILSSSVENMSDHRIQFANGIDKALTKLAQRSDIECVFIIGGAKVYNAALENPYVTKARVSIVHCDSKCDVFFPLDKARLCGWGDMSDSTTQTDTSETTTDPTTGIQLSIFERRKSPYT